MKVSQKAANLVGSEIIKLASEINERKKRGEPIFNLTIGDFDPSLFEIPAELKSEIIRAYKNNLTNYPAANGIPELRTAVAGFISKREKLEYSPDEFLISGGARPLIYAAYQAIVDPGDKVLFPVPSWNNNHYCHLTSAQKISFETLPENDFMPTAEEIAPLLKGVTLLALCSPLNPTGTVFSRQGLKEICELVIAENKRRAPDEKPLYLLYDQIYWTLTYGETEHFNPVSIQPEMREYTLFIDGISKAFAATGLRVGWAFGPALVIAKMKSLLSHIGAWAPKAEQVATGNFLQMDEKVESYLTDIREKLFARLDGFYKGLLSLKEKGLAVDAIPPKAAIYLTVSFDLVGTITPGGETLKTNRDVHQYLLEEAKLAIVPFYAFGASEESAWYRLSVGTAKLEEIPAIIEGLDKALSQLGVRV